MIKIIGGSGFRKCRVRGLLLTKIVNSG